MLVSLTVTNFKSIRGRQCFSMLAASKIKELPENVFEFKNKKLLKSAVVYGANGSGKSNLIHAFRALKHLVTHSANYKIDEKITDYVPYILDTNSFTNPVELEINFIAKDGLEYNYLIAFTANKITKEVLNFYPGKNPALLFERTNGEKIKYGHSIKQNLIRIEDSLYDNQLFLSKVGNEKVDILIPSYTFFKRHLSVHNIHDTYFDKLLVQSLARKFDSEIGSHSQYNITQLMKVADIGISDLHFKKESDERDPEKGLINTTVNTTHRIFNEDAEEGNVQFPILLESTGTNKLLSVGLFLLEALEDGDVIVIDELDKSLHPFITKLLIQIINLDRTNPKNAQLIFASHDVSLLNNRLFRRDQIHFVEKSVKGYSEYYQLSNLLGVRQNVSYEKYYMNGMFGGIPLINEYDLDFKFST